MSKNQGCVVATKTTTFGNSVVGLDTAGFESYAIDTTVEFAISKTCRSWQYALFERQDSYNCLYRTGGPHAVPGARLDRMYFAEWGMFAESRSEEHTSELQS